MLLFTVSNNYNCILLFLRDYHIIASTDTLNGHMAELEDVTINSAGFHN